MVHLHPATTLALALAAGIVAQAVARHLRVPGIVLLLGAGIGLGPDGLAWIEPRGLGDGLFAIVDLAVAIILFEGGLNLELSRLRRSQAAIRRLITWGGLVTLGGGAVAARAWLGWDWGTAFLFGSLVVVTGPTVIGPLISGLRLRARPATVLEAEGLLIDPIGAIVAVLVLDLVFSPGTGVIANEALEFLLRIGVGVAAGGVAGYLLARLLAVRRLVPEGYENIFALGFVLLTFQLCEEFLSHSGILAVTIAGAVVGNVGTRVDRDLREFKDQLTVMLIGLLFVLLAADVRFEQVRELGWAGLAVVATLALGVRPLGVALCTAGSDLSMRERVFIGWVAPRGIVAAAIASIVTATMEKEGVGGGVELRALVFLTIAVTVVLAGLTAGPVGTWLGVRLPGREGYAVLGGQKLGMALAEELRRGGERIVVIDANPQNCRIAEEAGFTTFYGDALKESTQQRAGFEGLKGVIALTPNKNLNGIFVTRARELFGVPDRYLAAESLDARIREIVDNDEAMLVFDGPHDLERWDVRSRRGAVSVERWRFEGPVEHEEGEAPAAPGERLAILTLERKGRVRPMHAALALEAGDEAAIAIHDREREEAESWLTRTGWARVEEEPEPAEAGEPGEPGEAEEREAVSAG